MLFAPCVGYAKAMFQEPESATTAPRLRSWHQLNLYTGNGSIIFAINTTMSKDSAGAPFLLLTTLYSSAVDDTCTATLTIDSCQIQTGIVEYPVVIQNSTVTLDSTKLNNVTVLSAYVFPGDLPSAPPGTPTGTLIGLNDFYGYYFGTNTEVLDPSRYTGFSMLADMFFRTDASSYGNFTFSACALTWSSPTSYVLRSMQDFLFRAALRTNNGTEVQAFPVQHTKPTLVFHSQYAYLPAASFIIYRVARAIFYPLPAPGLVITWSDCEFESTRDCKSVSCAAHS